MAKSQIVNLVIFIPIALLSFFGFGCSKPYIQTEQLIQGDDKSPKLKAATIATNYYVSTTGSNSNPGTESKPFLTIAYAALFANPGDVITVENGTYKTTSGGLFGYMKRSGNSSAYITYKARYKGGVILDGQNNYSETGFAVIGSYINIEGFEIKGLSGWGITVSEGASHVNLRDLNIHNIGRRCTETYLGLNAIYLSSSSYITIERCLLHDIGRYAPGEGGCSIATDYYKSHDHGVYVDGCSYLNLWNNIFYNIQRGFALQIYSGAGRTSSYINFVNNTLNEGNPFGIQGHVVLWGHCNNVLIANNIFKDQHSTAIQINNSYFDYYSVLITKNITSGGNGIIASGAAAGVTIANNFNNTDPLFVNELYHDYSLKSNSPALVAGYNTGVSTDYLGNTRTTINIGAYASLSAAPSTSIFPTSSVYYNVQMSDIATKNDCGTGYIGSTVTYTVPAGYYSSTISQTDADNIAIARLRDNKQFYANARGTCISAPSQSTVYYNVQMSDIATKNDCGSGYIGSTVTYTVPYGYYSSNISQADADNIAIARLRDNKQFYANARGTCTIAPSQSTIYYNVQMSDIATKNDCGPGYIGSTVTYTVPAGYYSSTISQADANNIAINRLRDNKQFYANARGTCTLAN
ncbi:MAG: DUF1565 domain-containing protein [Mariniphaga sp.]|nr:DUF1565 domain-containing protein [Mariniphaga sp.]